MSEGWCDSDGWTPSELAELRHDELVTVLRRDVCCAPVEGSEAALRRKVLEMQAQCEYRGTIRWIEFGEDVVLYDPRAARASRRDLKLLGSISRWGDLRRLVRQGEPISRRVVRYVWDRWEAGDASMLGISEDEFEQFEFRIATIDDLCATIPLKTPLSVENFDDEGEVLFINGYDPYQMGVPLLIIQRYYTDAENGVFPTNSWSSLAAEHLPDVKTSLNALGWRLAAGQPKDIPT